MTFARAFSTSLAIGITCAAGVAVFKATLRLLEFAVHGWVAPSWGEVGIHPVLVAPILGGLVVGLLVQFTRISKEPKSSVTQTIADIHDGEDFPANETPVQAAAAWVSLTTGAALGPTEPAVGVGATIGKLFERRTGQALDRDRVLVGVGAAAALSAALHAPLAATLFAFEVLRIRRPRAVVMAAAASTVAFVLIRYVDNVAGPEPRIPAYPLASPTAWTLAALIGITGGALSAGAIRLTYGFKGFFQNSGIPHVWRPVLVGIAIAGAGVASSGLLGIGYPTLEKVASGTFQDMSQLLGFTIGKTALMAASFASGFVGGFFAPSMFIGASVGSLIARAAHTVFPALQITPHALSVVGMSAMIAGMTRAPLTAIALLAEMSNGLTMIPAIAIGSLIAVVTSTLFERGSIYTYERVRQDPGHRRRSR